MPCQGRARMSYCQFRLLGHKQHSHWALGVNLKSKQSYMRLNLVQIFCTQVTEIWVKPKSEGVCCAPKIGRTQLGKEKQKLGRMRRQWSQSWDWVNATFPVLWKTVYRLCMQCLDYVFSRKLKLPVAESLASFFCSSDKYFYNWNNHDALWNVSLQVGIIGPFCCCCSATVGATLARLGPMTRYFDSFETHLNECIQVLSPTQGRSVKPKGEPVATKERAGGSWKLL